MTFFYRQFTEHGDKYARLVGLNLRFAVAPEFPELLRDNTLL